MKGELANIPYFGAGIGLRREIAEQTLQAKDEIDVLEVISEHFFDEKASEAHEFLDRFAQAFPVIPHGVKLSIGTELEINPEFLQSMRRLSERLGASYYSDHFALTRHGDDLDTGHLAPMWYTKEALDNLVRRIDTIQQYLGIPLVLENITAPFIIPNSDYEEPEFIAEIWRRTGCGLLLDITNININAFNRGMDPFELLSQYPLDPVVQIHLAGGKIAHGHFHDTHSEIIAGPNDAVWPMLDYVVERANIKTLIIERDENFKGDFETIILADLRKAKAALAKGKKGSRTASSRQALKKSHVVIK